MKVMVALLITSALATGCKDKAEPAFKKCLAAEADGNVLAAEAACKDAVYAGEDSNSGKAAADKLKAMQPAIDKANKQKADAQAAASKAAEDARVKRVAELRTKVNKRYSGDEPDAECAGKGYPAYRWYYEGGTFSEDETVAEADGCTKLHQTVELQVYCCPKRPFTGGLF